MKKLITTTLLTLCCLLAQAQWMRATLEYHDGSKETGLGKIRGKHIIYKASKQAPRQRLGSDKVKAVMLSGLLSEKEEAKYKAKGLSVFTGAWKYHYVKMRKGGPTVLMQVTYDGERIKGYKRSHRNWWSKNGDSTTYYYLMRSSEAHATRFNLPSELTFNLFLSDKVSKKGLLKYFADCPELCRKLEAGELENRISDVAGFFEAGCK